MLGQAAKEGVYYNTIMAAWNRTPKKVEREGV